MSLSAVAMEHAAARSVISAAASEVGVKDCEHFASAVIARLASHRPPILLDMQLEDVEVDDDDVYEGVAPRPKVEVERDATAVRCNIEACIAALRDEDGKTKSREMSLAVTKLQEAFFWLDEHNRLS